MDKVNDHYRAIIQNGTMEIKWQGSFAALTRMVSVWAAGPASSIVLWWDLISNITYCVHMYSFVVLQFESNCTNSHFAIH